MDWVNNIHGHSGMALSRRDIMNVCIGMRTVSFLGIFLGAICAFAFPLHAQFGLPGAQHALSISFSPLYPGPGETVSLTVQSPLFDISQSKVLWRANGKIIAQGTGVDSVQVQAGALGAATTVEVAVSTPDGTAASANATILPAELDLLVDSNTYIPPFYRGGARTSAGGELRLEARPRFRRGGAFVSASELTYTWRRNGEVMGSISGRGKASVIISAPPLFGTDTISVEARTSDGVVSRIQSLTLSSATPILALYENHPLFGILYHRALGPATFIPESEMTFTAVPFFAPARSADDPGLQYAWQVNGVNVASSPSRSNELTINAENSSGRALVGLDLTHATNYYLDARATWNITFSTEGSATNPFRTTQ